MDASAYDRSDLIVLDEVGSTNIELLERAAAGAGHGTALRARVQTSGRGRRAHSWASPDGGLYLSILLARPSPRACCPDCPSHAAWASCARLRRRARAGSRLNGPTTSCPQTASSAASSWRRGRIHPRPSPYAASASITTRRAASNASAAPCPSRAWMTACAPPPSPATMTSRGPSARACSRPRTTGAAQSSRRMRMPRPSPASSTPTTSASPIAADGARRIARRRHHRHGHLYRSRPRGCALAAHSRRQDGLLRLRGRFAAPSRRAGFYHTVSILTRRTVSFVRFPINLSL